MLSQDAYHALVVLAFAPLAIPIAIKGASLLADLLIDIVRAFRVR